MGHDYEMSDYNRSDLIFTKEMLLAEPLERTPLRARGRVAPRAAMAEVFFFIAAIGAIAGAIGVVALRNPFYSVLALVVPPARRWPRCSCCCARSSSPPRRSSSTPAR